MIQVVRYFKADGPNAQLVRIERNFYGTDDARRIDQVELLAGDRCLFGVHRTGTEYLLVFENDESVELREGEVVVGPILMWSRHDDSEPAATSSPDETGYAVSGDMVAVDLAFDPDQIWDWQSRPYPECERDDIALVVSE